MKYNYALAKKKFDEEWKRMEAAFLEAGMTPDAIQKIHEYDWGVFRGERVHLTHRDDTPIEEIEETIEQFPASYDMFGGHSRYWWLDEISSPCLTVGIPFLTDDDKELLTLYIVEQYSIREIAKQIGKQKSSVAERLQRIFSMFPTST